MAVTSATIATSDGESLHAEVALAEQPELAIVITHPHPLMGGNMFTPVPGAFFREAQELDGVAALRFDFRGVGRSTGIHDEGRAERLDVQAAVDHLGELVPGVPVLLAGWSFGADVSLAVDDARIAGWFLAAPPLRTVDPAEMSAAAVAAPKMLAIGEHDQFNPPGAAAATTADWTNTSVETIADADHFFGLELPALTAAFRSFVEGMLPGPG